MAILNTKTFVNLFKKKKKKNFFALKNNKEFLKKVHDSNKLITF